MGFIKTQALQRPLRVLRIILDSKRESAIQTEEVGPSRALKLKSVAMLSP